MTHKKGFTLVELLVVISTIGTLSSIILASLKDAQATARDSVRVQQVRQLDNATRSYVYANNQAPELSTCNPSTGTGCVAKSNAANGTPEKNAWNAYLSEMGNYIGATPVDPCGTSGCAVVGSSENTGYTYISPGGVQYYCDQLGTCGIDDYTESYQLSANLETNNTPSYGEGGYVGSLVALPSGTITITSPSSGAYLASPNPGFTVTWTTSGITNPSSIYVTVEKSDDNYPIAGAGPISPNATSVFFFLPAHNGGANVKVKINKLDGSYVEKSIPITLHNP